MAQTVKHLSTMRETQVQSLGGEDLLEKEMATYSSTLAWRIPWTEEPGGLQFMESQGVGYNRACTHRISSHSGIFGAQVWTENRDSGFISQTWWF